MLIKLLITKKSDPAFNKELQFNNYPIFLGRDDGNQVVLTDPYRIISRKHAKIINTEGILQIVDLESANCTYLNENRIVPNEENSLTSGDKIKIGDFELEVQLIKENKNIIVQDDEKTMVFFGPYKNDLENIVESLNNISVNYYSDNSMDKSTMLRYAISRSLSRLTKNEANKILAELFAENFLEKELTSSGQIKSNFPENDYIKGHDINKSSVMQKVKPAGVKQDLLQEYSFNSHFAGIIDLFLDIFSKLIQGFLHFRQEFFGVTIYYTIPTNSAGELKEYLFNTSNSPEEEKKRLVLLQEETLKLLSHQIGLLEGYKQSVTEGSKALLQSLNPETIERDISNKNRGTSGLKGKLFTGSKKTAILGMIKENYKKYISDPHYVEKKFFRPAFMKGYQKRSSNKTEDDF